MAPKDDTLDELWDIFAHSWVNANADANEFGDDEDAIAPLAIEDLHPEGQEVDQNPEGGRNKILEESKMMGMRQPLMYQKARVEKSLMPPFFAMSALSLWLIWKTRLKLVKNGLIHRFGPQVGLRTSVGPQRNLAL